MDTKIRSRSEKILIVKVAFLGYVFRSTLTKHYSSSIPHAIMTGLRVLCAFFEEGLNG